MRKLSALTYAFLSLLLVGNAWGQTNTKGIQFVKQGSAISCPSNAACMWVDTSNVSTLDASLSLEGSANRTIKTASAATGKNLLVVSGTSTDVGIQAGVMFLRSGDGGPTNGTIPAGAGGDLMILGGDAGSNGGDEADGVHGGNVFIGGGNGNNVAHQHGGILIGTEDVYNGKTVYADEIRLGHKPEYGTINLGHIRHLGYIADSTSIFPSDDYTLRFEIKATPHLIEGDASLTDGGAGTGFLWRGGKGGNGSASPGSIGGAITIQGGAGGNGTGGVIAGPGAPLNLYGGTAGTNGGAGGNSGGNIDIDAGAATGAATAGQVYVGTTTASATNIGRAGINTNILGLNNPRFTASNGNQSLNPADQPTTNTAGVKLTIKAGKGNGTGNGGDLLIVGADRGASGSFGGSVIIDGGNGNSLANSGVVLIGTNNAATNGQTFSVTIGTAGQPLTHTSIPQSASVPTISSASTIAPTTVVSKVSGTTTVSTITLPYTSFKGTIVIIPTGVFAWDTNGNIGLAGTSVVGKAIYFTCDGTTWYPSYT